MTERARSSLYRIELRRFMRVDSRQTSDGRFHRLYHGTMNSGRHSILMYQEMIYKLQPFQINSALLIPAVTNCSYLRVILIFDIRANLIWNSYD